MKLALSIAGSDPSGGGGLQADLQVFRALHVHGCGVVTAMTVQDTERVHQSLPAFPNVVLDQLRVVLRDLPPDVVKLGMLATDDIVRNVSLGLGMLEAGTPIVIDPVMLASDGSSLLERRAYGALGALFAGATLVTPNLPEVQALTECDVSTESGVEAAGAQLVTEFGAEAALVKGGHREGAPDDLLVERSGTGVTHTWLRGERIERGPVRGTGCILASAIAAHIAHGDATAVAVEKGRAFLRQALAAPVAEGARGRLLAYG
jgi:hydroxymethylpyrimidine/phosphomethylpyrimidine kinase